jgi:hypothetical protein
MTNKKSMWHYTNRMGWDGVNNGHDGYIVRDPKTGKYYDSEDVRGLWPHRRLIEEGNGSSVPVEAERPAIFGLPEPQPKSWLKYEDCTKLWGNLMKRCADRTSQEDRRIILLEVDLFREDEPIVVDYVHIRRASRDCENEINPRKERAIMIRGFEGYWNSRISFFEYNGGFILPEVVVFNPIPPERIHLSWEKNLQEFLVSTGHGDKIESFTHDQEEYGGWP